MTTPETFELIVLGAGSAGYAAARTAGELGAKVALVDKGPLGGLCILAGCMPSKALIQSARIAHHVSHAGEFGIEVAGWKPNFQAIMARKDRLISGFTRYREEGIASLPNTTLIQGEARFLDGHTLAVGDRVLTAPKFILATGSTPMVPPIEGLNDVDYMLSDHTLTLKALPASMVVIGGGIIALELGQFFTRLGTRVTLVEAAPRLVSREDPDVSAVIHRRLVEEGMTIYTGVKPFRAEARGDRKVVVFSDAEGRTQEAAGDVLVVATGREPNVKGLDLDKAGVRMEGRRMRLNRCLATTNTDIFAAGDVTGGSFLVHVAIAEAELAARNALMGCAPVPAPEHLFISAAFTEPNIARVGLSETEARQLGREVLVGKYMFGDHGKAEILNEVDGFVKMLADPRTGEIMGATIVGPEGAELIHEMAAAITLRATVEQFLQIPHVHPTLAEILTYPAEAIVEQMRTLGRGGMAASPAGYNDSNEEDAFERAHRTLAPKEPGRT